MHIMRTVSLAATLSALIVMPFLCHGQEAARPAAGPDISAITVQLADIDKMRLLTPLQLSDTQIGTLLAALTAAQAEYRPKLDAVDVAADAQLAALRPDIEAAHARALAGGAIPADLDQKIIKIQADATTQRKKLMAALFSGLVTATKAILTESQQTSAIATMKAIAKKDPEMEWSGPDKAFYNIFVRTAFIDYPRISGLLEDMRKARKSPRP